MDLILVTGSAGFIGTNLVNHLLENGNAVIGIDNFSASQQWKSEIHKDNPNYEFVQHDITEPFARILENSRLLSEHSEISHIYNLACPASPPRYQALPLETIAANTTGVINLLELAKRYGAKMLQSSTSEVYGDPEVHPQSEDYRGLVNTVGPRSCYDEGKRMAETICYEYRQQFGVDVKLVRIFNTYGPYMDPDDGRVITNFILQSLKGEGITIYGEGNQTRSFQFVTDLIAGIEKLMQTESDFMGPVNIGNPNEFTIRELADIVLEKTESSSELTFKDLPTDDPKQRQPDISLAKSKLDWEPKVALEEGLTKTVEYYKGLLEQGLA